ncbi:unnamed protein product [Sphenostylis stenocarpa]|uniref:Uncharacterized protein n=1 Tax=Sphenostylis stenocarpa TaxID=92480 RepID=A0AA86VL60_9FABA|nr:unnamed protein product [Sphenostylis stenocarpa]
MGRWVIERCSWGHKLHLLWGCRDMSHKWLGLVWWWRLATVRWRSGGDLWWGSLEGMEMEMAWWWPDDLGERLWGACGGRLVVLRVAMEELRPELNRGCAGSSEGLRRELEWCWSWLEVKGKRGSEGAGRVGAATRGKRGIEEEWKQGSLGEMVRRVSEGENEGDDPKFRLKLGHSAHKMGWTLKTLLFFL